MISHFDFSKKECVRGLRPSLLSIISIYKNIRPPILLGRVQQNVIDLQQNVTGFATECD